MAGKLLQGHPRIAGSIRLLLFAFAWCNVLLFLIFLFRIAVYEPFTLKFLPNIPYHYGPSPGDGTDALFEASTYILALAFEFFVPPALAGLAVITAEALPAGEFHSSRAMSRVSRVLGWQVPGRRFWSWWCGGLSLGELLFYLGALGAYASWMEYYLKSEYDYADAVLSTVDIDKNLVYLEQWALSFGLALYPCFLLLFWPIAHDSFLNHMLGLPWQNMIKYHRWLGHITMWVMSAHGIAYFLLWAIEKQFWVQFSSWKDSIPFLPGSLAWFGGLALQITSLYVIRRKWFDLFYKVHVIGFVIILIFSCIHYARSWFYFLPGLVPWAADLVFRFAQGASITTITSATISDDERIITWELQLEDGQTAEPLHDYLINIPNISRWGWHPFTVSRCVGNKITFNTKRYGAFTTDLLKQLKRGLAVPVRVQGPIGIHTAEQPWLKYPVLVCVTGGIGISPVLAILQGLVADRSGAKGAAPFAGPKRVIVVWASRHKSEFTILEEAVINAAREDNSWLSISLHYTGAHMERASSINANKVMSESKTVPGDLASSDTSDTASTASFKEAGGRGCPLGMGDVLRFPWFSPLGFSLVRPVQPKWGGTAQKLLVFLLVNLGGFCGLSLASAYYGEGNAQGLFLYDGSTYYFYWKYGALLILGAFIGGLGLPVFAVHTWAAWRYFGAVRRTRAEDQFMVGDGSPPAIEKVDRRASSLRQSDVRPTTRYASTLVGGRVGVVESGAMLNIAPHRPDIRASLQEAVTEAAELAAGADVGVYVAGPHGMVVTTKRLVADLNGARPRGAPAMHFHQETWEL